MERRACSNHVARETFTMLYFFFTAVSLRSAVGVSHVRKAVSQSSQLDARPVASSRDSPSLPSPYTLQRSITSSVYTRPSQGFRVQRRRPRARGNTASSTARLGEPPATRHGTRSLVESGLVWQRHGKGNAGLSTRRQGGRCERARRGVRPSEAGIAMQRSAPPPPPPQPRPAASAMAAASVVTPAGPLGAPGWAVAGRRTCSAGRARRPAQSRRRRRRRWTRWRGGQHSAP